MNKCVIIGCGWLGQQVGEKLADSNWKVFGSYRRAEVRNQLKTKGIYPFEMEWEPNSEIPIEVSSNTDLLIITLPPQQKNRPTFYAGILQGCVQQFPKAKVIFTSSIGVYPQKPGIFKEDFEFEPDQQVSSLFLAEKSLHTLLGDRLTILRLGGLIGPDRHPAKYMQGKSYSDDGSTPVNLIDSRDIIRAIELIWTENRFNKVYNLVHPDHITKKNYYSGIIEQYGFSPIQFGTQPGLKRRVDGTLIQWETGFSYVWDPARYNESLS